MDIIEFFRYEQRRTHGWIRSAVSDLTPEEWNAVPAGRGNSIAFLVWHVVRSQDLLLRSVLQNRPQIWHEEGWSERLELPEHLQGSGMESEEARTLQIADPALFMTYVERVWNECEAHLAAVTDGGAELSMRKATLGPFGTMPAILAVSHVYVSHPLMHYGEIALLRGLLQKQGFPI